MPFLTLSNNPEKRQRQVERGQAVDRENERRMNVQELFDAINMIRAQENTVVRRKPESQGDIPRYASPRSEPRHEMREAPLPSYTDTLGALKYNLSPTLGVAQLVALPALVYDLGETAVDALRGTNSPSRFRQVANALSKGMGGPSMPNTAAEWRGELAGSLLNPANFVSAVGSPLRMLRSVPAALRHGAEGFAQAVPVSNVIKNKGGNWLTGSVEDALSGLKKPVREDTYLAQIRSQHDAPEGMYESVLSQNAKATAINSFIDKQLTRYVKNEMATPEDPIRALAERGVLPVNQLPDVSPKELSGIKAARAEAGFPEEGSTRWEDLADIFARGQPASQVKRGWFMPPDYAAKINRENQWLNKVPDSAQVYGTGMRGRNVAEDLGFPHLIDELSNALNPESGLPRHLLLDPKSMDRVSVPQAVERVSQINAWRAAQKAEADALRANNAATVLHKDYPDKGFKWVELRKADKLPEGWKPHPDEPTLFSMPDGSPTMHDPREKALQDALKYEGDTMGHCVGGYCDDVASGRSRIYSLRDAKGQPHVTVEVQPMKAGYLPEPSVDPSADIAPRIVQIKGKQNRAPNEEYLPFVQDFVRSGQWSDVGDLQNTGLVKFSGGKTNIREGGSAPFENLNMPTGYMTRREAADFLEAQGVPTLAARRHVGDLEGLLDLPGYAHGGSVSTPVTVSDLRAIMAQLRMEHSNA